MARKEFRYRGHTLEELKKLSNEEMLQLYPSRIRRTLKRGYPEAAKKALASIMESNEPKTHVREIVITPHMVGKIIKVYNGKEFKDIRVEAEMIGHVLGEFSQTRATVRHSSPGVGATKSGMAMSVR